jgi:hypothetical protein
LTIEIQLDKPGPWEIQVWRSGGDPTVYVYADEENEPRSVTSLNRLPIELAKSYFSQLYFSDYKDVETRNKAITAMGDLATALTRLLAEKGRLYLPRKCCKEMTSKCSATQLKKIMSNDRVSDYNRAATEYGWSNLTNGQDRAYKLLNAGIHEVSAHTAEQAMEQLHRACSLFIKDAVGSEVEPSHVTDPAMYIALDSIATSTVTDMHVQRYFSPLNSANLTETDNCVGAMLSKDGLDIQTFRSLAFTHLLPGYQDVDNADLIVAQNGYVVGMAVMWQCSTLQRNVLAIKYTKGQIKYDGNDYESIREVDSYAAPPVSSQEPIPLFQFGRYIGLAPKTETISFETKISIRGNRLAVKRYMFRPREGVAYGNMRMTYRMVDDRYDKQKASWVNSILVLATALHIGHGYELTPENERLLAERLREDVPEMRWASGMDYERAFYSERWPRLLLKTEGKESLRFFAAGVSFYQDFDQKTCLSFVVRHNAPLLSCVYAAQKKNKPWVIAC